MTATDIFASVFIFAIWAIGLGADVYFIKKGGVENSISFRVALWSQRYPIIPALVFGTVMLLVGHLFWPNTEYCGGGK